ncbi:TPA: S8 family serine peptidase [Streptococcus agalactiae]
MKNNNTLNDICKSIVKLINMDVDIILLSLGVENKNDVSELFNVCQLAIERNVIIVAAHSNNNITAYPASFNNVIGIKSRDIKSNKFFEYDHVDNDIRFNIKDSSFYHINNRIKKGLVVGNSFLAGTFVGILSNYCVNLKKTNLVNLISNIEKSIGNSRCTKINNEHQIIYFYKYLSLKELQVISSKGYVLFKGENNSLINLSRYYSKSNVDNIFFNEFISKKYLIDLIEKIILNKKIDNIYTRYPIFNFFEREQIYSKYRITIKQFIL